MARFRLILTYIYVVFYIGSYATDFRTNLQPSTPKGNEDVEDFCYTAFITKKLSIWNYIQKVFTNFIFIITKRSKLKPDWACTGTIISSRLVVTAAHCLHKQNVDEIQVITGLAKTNEQTNIYDVQEFIIHPTYMAVQGELQQYDIGLVVLSQAICLNKNNTTECAIAISNEVNYGKSATIAGWSVVCETIWKTKYELQWHAVELINFKDCLQMYNDIKTGRHEMITQSLLCTRTPNITIGASNAGGPVVQNGQLVGIIFVESAKFGEFNFYIRAPDISVYYFLSSYLSIYS